MDPGNLLYDRHADAAEIERRLVKALLEADRVDLGSLTDGVLDLHPERASWVTLLNRLWQADLEGGAPSVHAELLARSAEIAEGRFEIAERVLEALGPRHVVLTLSNQPCVIAAMAASAGRRRVLIGESRPLREGVTAARDLAAVGVEVCVVADGVLIGLPLTAATLPPPLHFEREDAAVLLGSDALLSEGFFVKAGGRALAEVAALAGVDLVVVAPPECLLPAVLATRFTPPAADPVDLGAPAAVHPVHLPTEFLPWRLVSSVVVGNQILRPSEIAGRTTALSVATPLRERWRARFL